MRHAADRDSWVLHMRTRNLDGVCDDEPQEGPEVGLKLEREFEHDPDIGWG